MRTYVISAWLTPGTVKPGKRLAELDAEVMGPAAAEIASIEWVGSFAVPDRDAYVAFFRAPDDESAERVSAVLRETVHARAELCTVAEWDPFAISPPAESRLHRLPLTGVNSPLRPLP